MNALRAVRSACLRWPALAMCHHAGASATPAVMGAGVWRQQHHWRAFHVSGRALGMFDGIKDQVRASAGGCHGVMGKVGGVSRRVSPCSAPV